MPSFTRNLTGIVGFNGLYKARKEGILPSTWRDLPRIRFVLAFAIISIFSSLTCSPCYANFLSLDNVELKESSELKYIQVEFDISWDNSWRNNVNHDAVWVYVKFSTDAGSTWSHATLKTAGTNPSGVSQGSGTALDLIIPADKMGCFIQRSSQGTGTVDTDNIQLVWDWNADGLSVTSQARVRVFGVEMVYVPEADFYLGDGSGVAESTQSFHVTDDTATLISSSMVSGVTVDTNAQDDATLESGIGIDGDGGLDADNDGTVDKPLYPTGHQAFYMMKHEVSQGQWIDFFNALSDVEKANRDLTSVTGKNSDAVVDRNAIVWSSGNATLANGREGDRANNYMSWMDAAAFADWAGLRPMTELEYEKAVRGSGTNAVNGEYAWGNTTIVEAVQLSGTESGTETITTSGANANYSNAQGFTGGDGSNGPLRVGVFSETDTTRTESGGGYFGAMDLSGNLWEMSVTLGNATGRNFQGTHGDGALSTVTGFEGNATNTDWPGIDATDSTRGVTGATGSGLRGGSWNTTSAKLRVSDRSSAAITASSRDASYGFRAVRTAP